MSLFGVPGAGSSNNYSNLSPGTYSVEFTTASLNPVKNVQQALIRQNLTGQNPVQGQLLAQQEADAISAQLSSFSGGGITGVAGSTDNPNQYLPGTADVIRGMGPPRDLTSFVLGTLNNKRNGRDLGGRPQQRTRQVQDPQIVSNVLSQGEAAYLYQDANQPKPIASPTPGIVTGGEVNALLTTQNVPVQLGLDGKYYGGGFTQIYQERIDTLNGFGYVVNASMYGRDPNAVGTPKRPIIIDNFYVSFGTSQGSPNVGRINQYAGTATQAYPGITNINNSIAPVWQNVPSGVKYTQTQGLSMYMNVMAGRTIYLVRRKAPYYFHMPVAQEYAGQLPTTVNIANLDLLGGLYFTTDPQGGGPWNDLNIINGQAYPPPILPNAPYILYPGRTIQIVVDNTWPDLCFYQSTLGPFMGGMVVAVGSLTIGA